MLLVAGDSFAEFPKDPMVHHPGVKTKDGYPHWAEIISNHDAISTGTGGSDIGYTSMIAMEELYQNNYTHCIFFITDFGRIPLQPVKDNMAILNKSLTSLDSPQDFYGSRKRVRPKTKIPGVDDGIRRPVSHYLLPYGGYQTGHICIPTNDNGEGGYSMSKYDDVETLSFLNYHHAGNFETLLKDDPEIHDYLKLQPTFNFMHTKLGHISLLKNYCNNNNIKILFVCPFLNQNQVVNLKNFLQIEVFDIYQTVSKRTLFESAEFRECHSHFNKEQHKMLAEYFNKDYSGWI